MAEQTSYQIKDIEILSVKGIRNYAIRKIIDSVDNLGFAMGVALLRPFILTENTWDNYMEEMEQIKSAIAKSIDRRSNAFIQKVAEEEWVKLMFIHQKNEPMEIEGSI